jgi:hypothetical protein
MDSVPDATTLIKLNHRFGEERMAELNRLLIKSLVKTRSIKPRRIRIDSTTLAPNYECIAIGFTYRTGDHMSGITSHIYPACSAIQYVAAA